MRLIEGGHHSIADGEEADAGPHGENDPSAVGAWDERLREGSREAVFTLFARVEVSSGEMSCSWKVREQGGRGEAKGATDVLPLG